VIVHRLIGETGHHHQQQQQQPHPHSTPSNINSNDPEIPPCNADTAHDDDETEVISPHCVGCSADPLAELNEWKHFAEEEEERKKKEQKDGRFIIHKKKKHGQFWSNDTSGGSPTIGSVVSNSDGEDLFGDEEGSHNTLNTQTTFVNGLRRIQEEHEGSDGMLGHSNTPSPQPCSVQMDLGQLVGEPKNTSDHPTIGTTTNSSIFVQEQKQPDPDHPHHEHKKLVRMGTNTALAIALHNFPEGLATFVGALHDTRVGVVLAVAIGIHNVPEGLCVALPIYYASGHRRKAFMWGVLSGISEPFAALLGWAVLANSFDPIIYGVMFGFVSGMMVIISLKELIPTAHRYDPDDTVVTNSLIVGMFVMALSLVLFTI